MVFKVAFSFIAKIFAFKKGALFLTSMFLSTGLTVYLRAILEGTETKRLTLPIVVHIAGFSFFFLFNLVDLGTGLWNAKYQNLKQQNPQKNFIKSHKLYRTLWKMLGIMLLNTMIASLCLFTEVIDGEYSYYFTLWALVTMWLMASGFEFHSIGENIEKRTGNKPEIFGFWDSILTAMQKMAIKKVSTAFDVLESEPKDQEPETSTNYYEQENINPKILENETKDEN